MDIEIKSWSQAGDKSVNIRVVGITDGECELTVMYK